MTVEMRMKRARTQLLIQHPFFGTLAMRLSVKRDDSIGTMATNGRDLVYSASFVEGLTDPELIGVYAHEVEHCALLHPFRRGSRDHQEFNVACDYAINSILIDAGLTLPKGALIDKQYSGMSAEQIYAKRKAQGKKDPNQGQPSPTGEFQDAPTPQDGDGQGQGQGKEQGQGKGAPGKDKGQGGQDSSGDDASSEYPTAEDWKIASEQAAMAARKAGKMSSDADRAMKAGRQSPQDWKQILREFVAATIPSDYSWSHPNRRYVGQSIYLPGMIKENTGELVIGVDTSGSIDGPMLESFRTEIQAIMDESRPEKIHVVYCDSAVKSVQEFIPGDELTLEAKGGGGTRFQPVFDWVGEKDITPKALIYLTDLDNFDSPIAPDYPVLWVAPEWATKIQAFGELVRMSDEQT